MLAAVAPLVAQTRPNTDPNDAYPVGEFVVKTVPLKHLSSAEAVKLLQPYVISPGGGVFEVSTNVRAVTIRELAKPYTIMMRVLAQYDRDPTNVTLRFQLVAADNGGSRDPSVAGLDSLLRGVLKYSGYRLLTTAVVNITERSSAQQTLSAGGELYKLYVDVSEMASDNSGSSIKMHVSLTRTGAIEVNGVKSVDPTVLSTGVTIPIGNTVVLGTGVESIVSTPGGRTGDRALILTVRPELTFATPRKD
jgi:hypothetical protein